MDVDDENRVMGLVWIDPRSMNTHKNFGDVVTFDLIYYTNRLIEMYGIKTQWIGAYMIQFFCHRYDHHRASPLHESTGLKNSLRTHKRLWTHNISRRLKFGQAIPFFGT